MRLRYLNMSHTIQYYDNNADFFFQNTYQVNMESLYASFTRYLPKHAKIFDLGCGSGRDTLAFLQKGYVVEAIDYSKVLVEKATEFTGLPIRFESFYDLSEYENYDGVWACASLLHCEREKLPNVLQRILNALKINGICYMSFKYGNQERKKEGRNFTDLDEVLANDLFKLFDNIILLQQWITVDKRPSHTDEWLNLIIRKTH